ncbi:hypothetical protein EVAR_26417_1 [Eumeta japonica]|uniref:Uncharacterized protein n=1 Tax=Eumeta variegata TaxID=151549 RepID=A0A4C1VQ21_EUMVA|nr:hypothetical protein EVAR_26417_1 [Eumeta japonica]
MPKTRPLAEPTADKLRLPHASAPVPVGSLKTEIINSTTAPLILRINFIPYGQVMNSHCTFGNASTQWAMMGDYTHATDNNALAALPGVAGGRRVGQVGSPEAGGGDRSWVVITDKCIPIALDVHIGLAEGLMSACQHFAVAPGGGALVLAKILFSHGGCFNFPDQRRPPGGGCACAFSPPKAELSKTSVRRRPADKRDRRGKGPLSELLPTKL